MSTITWDNANFTWDNNSFTWDEVLLVIEAIASLGAPGDGDAPVTWADWDDDEDKKKRFVELILKVHGKTITERKQKEIKQYKIKANDIKITVEKVLGVELMTENIKF
mgnify:FL=1